MLLTLNSDLQEIKFMVFPNKNYIQFKISHYTTPGDDHPLNRSLHCQKF